MPSNLPGRQLYVVPACLVCLANGVPSNLPGRQLYVVPACLVCLTNGVPSKLPGRPLDVVPACTDAVDLCHSSDSDGRVSLPPCAKLRIWYNVGHTLGTHITLSSEYV